MVVLSPPGMMRDVTVRSCSGFRISTPFTPNLLRAATQENEDETKTLNK